ncbi:hypothetical protein U1872_15935 [Sphingomonas sp. RB3P16]|uniref:hypothetical protein n=1 Tax=Parasphingomonas frigoris TaxID=3096163 RepID=UPI002FC97171
MSVRRAEGWVCTGCGGQLSRDITATIVAMPVVATFAAIVAWGEETLPVVLSFLTIAPRLFDFDEQAIADAHLKLRDI